MHPSRLLLVPLLLAAPPATARIPAPRPPAPAPKPDVDLPDRSVRLSRDAIGCLFAELALATRAAKAGGATLPPSTLAVATARLQLEPGDRVLEAAGVRLGSVDAVLRAFGRARELPSFDLSVRRGDRTVTIRVHVGALPAPAEAAPGEAGTGAVDAAASDGVRQLDDTHWDLRRGFWQQQFADLSELGRQARIVPNYRDGQYRGFKIIGVRPSSVYRLIGLRSGDVVLRVNGRVVDTPTAAVAMFTEIRDAVFFTLEIERRGETRTHVYRVVDDADWVQK